MKLILHFTQRCEKAAIQYTGETGSASSTVLTQNWSKWNKVKMEELNKK